MGSRRTNFCVPGVKFRAERVKGEASQITADELDGLVRSIRQGLNARCRRLPNRLFIIHKDKTGKEVSTYLDGQSGYRIPDRSIFVATAPQSELNTASPDIFVRLKSPADRSVAYDKFVAMARTLTDGTPTEPLTSVNWNPNLSSRNNYDIKKRCPPALFTRRSSFGARMVTVLFKRPLKEVTLE